MVPFFVMRYAVIEHYSLPRTGRAAFHANTKKPRTARLFDLVGPVGLEPTTKGL